MKCKRCGKRAGVESCGGYCQPCVVKLIQQGYAWHSGRRDWLPTARLFGDELPNAAQVGPQVNLFGEGDEDAEV